MSPELEERFYAAFPDLFRGRDKPITESLMCYGLQCDDHWFHLLWQHCSELESLALAEGRERGSENWPEITQIKEKFGTIRCHVRHASAAMQSLKEKLILDSQRHASIHACFDYLESEGCFEWKLVVKVNACHCSYHGKTRTTGNVTDLGGYEVHVEALVYSPMGNVESVTLFFHTESQALSQQAQALFQSGAVLLVNSRLWDLGTSLILYLENLEQVSPVPPEHTQAVAGLMDKTEGDLPHQTQTYH